MLDWFTGIKPSTKTFNDQQLISNFGSRVEAPVNLKRYGNIHPLGKGPWVKVRNVKKA